MTKWSAKIGTGLNISGLLYGAVALLLLVLVDWKTTELSRMRYLLASFLNGGRTNFQDGVLYFDKKSRIEKENDTAFAALGICYFNLGEYDKAMAAYRQAIALNPENSRYPQHLSLIEKKANNPSLTVPPFNIILDRTHVQ